MHCIGPWYPQDHTEEYMEYVVGRRLTQNPSRQKSERRVFAYYRLDIGTLAASRGCPATFCEMFIKSTLQQLRYLLPQVHSTASLLLQRFMHFFSVCDCDDDDDDDGRSDVCCFSSKTNATVLSLATPHAAALHTTPPRPAPPRQTRQKKMPSLTFRVFFI